MILLRLASFIYALILTSSIHASQSGQWTTYTWNYSISDMVRDGNDLWIATGGGLYLLDASDLSVKEKYTTSEGLYDNGINALAKDTVGNIWFGSKKHFDFPMYARIDDGVFTFFNHPENCLQEVSAMEVDATGTLWIGKRPYAECGSPESLTSFNGETWTNHFLPDDLDFTYINKIEVDAVNNIWTHSHSGIYMFDGHRWERICKRWNEVERIYVERMAVSPEGRLYVLYEDGIYRYNAGTWESVGKSMNIPFTDLSDLMFDNCGNMWITSGNYLAQYTSDTWRVYAPFEAMEDEVIGSIYFDDDNTIWIGTKDGSILTFDNNHWRSGSINTGYPFGAYGSFLPVSSNATWILSENGLTYWENGEWTFYPLDHEDYNKIRKPIWHNGEIWTFGYTTLFRFDGTQYYSIPVTGLDEKETIQRIASGSNNDVWILTNRNLLRYHEDEFTNYTITFEIQNYTYNNVLDDNGTVWLAGHRIVRFHDGEITVFNTLEVSETEENYFEGLDTDSHNNIWTVTRNAILCRYDGQSWTQTPVMNGDYDSRIWRFEIDSNDNIWTDNYIDGLFRYDGQNWEHITTEHGLVSMDIGSFQSANDGSVWIKGGSGVSLYIPDTATDVHEPVADSSPSPLSITGNSPNPFNPATSIGFTLPSGGRAELVVYAITGQKVATLVDGFLTAGAHTARWNGRRTDGAACSSGVYIALLKADGHTAAHRMLLVK